MRLFNSTLTRDIALPVNATIDQLPLSGVQGFKEVALPWYSDQVLPFDITLAAANEYGAAASCKIFGVEILNEGFGSWIDDSVLEQQAIALHVKWHSSTSACGSVLELCLTTPTLLEIEIYQQPHAIVQVCAFASPR